MVKGFWAGRGGSSGLREKVLPGEDGRGVQSAVRRQKAVDTD